MQKSRSKIIIEDYKSNFNYKKNETNLNIKFNRVAFIFFTFFIIYLIYTIYLSYTNQAVPKNIDELKENVSTNEDKFKSVASKSIDQAKKSTKNAIEKEIDKKIEKILDK